MPTIGIIGGGQLGRMLALAGYPLGLRFVFLEEAADCPAARLGRMVVGPYDAEAALQEFASAVDLVTYEFENVPVAAAQWLQHHGRDSGLRVYPPAEALEVAQDRLIEKTTLNQLGIPTARYADIRTLEDLRTHAAAFGFPAILKTRRLGYDGKGQVALRGPEDLDSAWARLNGQPLILETHVPFQRELAILGVRSAGGETAFYPLTQTEHQSGILRRAFAPAPDLGATTQAQAEAYMRKLLEHLNYVGILALELFDCGGELLGNEIAPRVHNSGHWTQDGAVTSQFENHLRAILGWPLGECGMRGHAAMLNLIGTAPRIERLLGDPGARVHLYDKAPRHGRKLGHVNFVGGSADETRAALHRAESLLAVRHAR